MPDQLIPPPADDAHDDLAFNNTPNQLTLFRILIVPVVVGCLMAHTRAWDIVATVLFSVASITDYFDGYLARKYKIETVYGKLMDPLADKFLVICSLIMLQSLGEFTRLRSCFWSAGN